MKTPPPTPQTITQLERSYDEIQYFEGHAFPHSHVQHLGALATAHGLSPAPPERSRVLDLGCGTGGNLLGMAQCLPDATFFGVDLSAQQVNAGKNVVAKLELKNISLQHCDLLDITPDFGQFDYIICHGVFSWVPKHIQDKILSICKQNLSTNGIAMISYITQPGSQAALSIVDLLRYHLVGIDDPAQRTNNALSLLKIMGEMTPAENGLYSNIFKSLYAAAEKDTTSFYHEYLNVETSDFYYHQFVHWANQHELQYVGEALRSHENMLSPEIELALSTEIPDTLKREQYRDFIVNRKTRHSILTHENATFQASITPKAIKDFYICGALHPQSEQPNINTEKMQKFTFTTGGTAESAHRLVKTALALLNKRWPLGYYYSELVDASAIQLGDHMRPDTRCSTTETGELANFLLQTLECGGTEIRLDPPNCIGSISSCPAVTELSRLRAGQRAGVPLTNQRNQNIHIHPFGKRLIRHLDGTHDIQSLIDFLVEDVRTQKLTIRPAAQQALPSAIQLRTGLEKTIRQALEFYRVSSLLVA